MKLKMYLRGLGIGMIITAIVMGLALGGRSRASGTMTDEEVIARARELGMEDRATLMSQWNAQNAASAEALTATLPSSDTSASDTGEEDGAGDTEGEDPEGGAGTEGSDPESSEGASGSEDTEEGDDAGAGASDSAAAASSEDEELIPVPGAGASASSSSSASGASSSGASASSSASSSASFNSSADADDYDSYVYFAEDDDNAEQTADPEGEVPIPSSSSSGGASSQEEAAEEEEEEEQEVLTGSTVVTIPGGVSSETASSHLAQAGVVDDAIAFNSFLIRNGYDRYIQSGTKQIPRGASYDEVARIITGRRR